MTTMTDQNQTGSRDYFPDFPKTRLPLPIATGGIGLFITAVFPGGLSGGAGFLIGFTIGILLIALIASLSHTSSQAETPNAVRLSDEELLSNSSEINDTQPQVEQMSYSHGR